MRIELNTTTLNELSALSKQMILPKQILDAVEAFESAKCLFAGKITLLPAVMSHFNVLTEDNSEQKLLKGAEFFRDILPLSSTLIHDTYESSCALSKLCSIGHTFEYALDKPVDERLVYMTEAIPRIQGLIDEVIEITNQYV